MVGREMRRIDASAEFALLRAWRLLGRDWKSKLLLFHLLVKGLRELLSRVYTGYLVRMAIGKAGFVGQPRVGSQMRLSDALWLRGSRGPGPGELGPPRSLGPLLRLWEGGFLAKVGGEGSWLMAVYRLAKPPTRDLHPIRVWSSWVRG